MGEYFKSVVNGNFFIVNDIFDFTNVKNMPFFQIIFW